MNHASQAREPEPADEAAWRSSGAAAVGVWHLGFVFLSFFSAAAIAGSRLWFYVSSWPVPRTDRAPALAEESPDAARLC